MPCLLNTFVGMAGAFGVWQTCRGLRDLVYSGRVKC